VTPDEATRVARVVAARFGVEVISVGPTAGSDDYELRMKHPGLDWYGVIRFNLVKPVEHFKDEVVGLARTTAEGPSA
jgi:hypothetical protein